MKNFVYTARHRTIEIRTGNRSSPPPTPWPATSMKPPAASTTIPLRTN